MGTLMESRLTDEQHALIRKVLIAQTESLGRLETPFVQDLLTEHGSRTVLDIGCGGGSFLLKLAKTMKNISFLGIDHSERSIGDALGDVRTHRVRNVKFRTAFFDTAFDRTKRDAIITRYTLQHSSDPPAFMDGVFERLKRRGLFIALESLDTYTDCHEQDAVWEGFRSSVAAIHRRVGSNDNIGKSLGLLLNNAGFRDIRVYVILCAPSTVGVKRFQNVVQSSAEFALTFFPDLFDQKLFDELKAWLNDSKSLQDKDPYICSAIAHGVKP